MSKIKRYDHDLQTLQPVEHEDGYWVKYSDHRQQLEEMLEEFCREYNLPKELAECFIQSKLQDDE